jgi:response regulator of citrate/malate metabolism
MGLVIPLPFVIAIVFLHRLQFMVFDDCLLSKWQKKANGLSHNKHFLQFAVNRIFGKKINDKQSHKLDTGLIILTIVIAAVATSV